MISDMKDFGGIFLSREKEKRLRRADDFLLSLCACFPYDTQEQCRCLSLPVLASALRVLNSYLSTYREEPRTH